MSKSVFSRLIVGIVAIIAPVASLAETPVESYKPEISGVFRGRYELATEDGSGRFQVRNARVSIQGKVAPIIGYRLQTDFSDRGEIKILDAYATIVPVKPLTIKVGQYRMPFGMDSFRGPASYFFNNRSFIGRRVNNVRAVGVSAAYILPGVPLTFDAGVFNPTSISDHERWVKKYAFAGKITYTPGDFEFSAGAQSLLPENIRVNLYGVAAAWQCDRFRAEAEYMFRTYASDSHPTTHAVNVFADYGIPLRHSLFDTWSFQARFDAMGDLASGVGDVDGVLPTTEPARQRVTVGSTLDYTFNKLRAAIRLNYEFIFHDAPLDAGSDDKLSVELIVKF